MCPDARESEPPRVEPPDWLLSAVLRGHLFLTQRVVRYGWLLKKWRRRGWKPRDFAPVYALGWLLIIAGGYALSPLWIGEAWASVPVLLVAGWRYLDILLWYLGLLLECPTHPLCAR